MKEYEEKIAAIRKECEEKRVVDSNSSSRRGRIWTDSKRAESTVPYGYSPLYTGKPEDA